MENLMNYIESTGLVEINEAKLSELSSKEVIKIIKPLKVKYKEHKGNVYLSSISDAQNVSDELAGEYDIVFDDQPEKIDKKDAYKLVIFK